MPIDIDGYAVLGAIASKPQAFPAIKNDVSRTSRALVIKQLKEKSLSLDHLRSIAALIGQDVFELILDPMSDTEIRSLLGKVDALNVGAKAATPASQRRRIADLARGAAADAAHPAAVEAAHEPDAPAEAVERAINSRSMTAKKKKKAKPK